VGQATVRAVRGGGDAREHLPLWKRRSLHYTKSGLVAFDLFCVFSNGGISRASSDS
jgi:hypothetical protein